MHSEDRCGRRTCSALISSSVSERSMERYVMRKQLLVLPFLGDVKASIRVTSSTKSPPMPRT